MKRIVLTVVILSLNAIVYSGCKKPETFPDIPSIEFRSLSVVKNVLGKDSLSVITISFTDGDGDIGYGTAEAKPPFNDTASIYYNNFIVSFFEKKNGVWVKDTVNVPPLSAGYSGRLPYLTPEGNNKALKGEISMYQLIWTDPKINDTIRYEVYIFDRALHQSNTITTSDLVISTN